ncbi:hypothetical protein D3C72_2545800 [compost metagenome]
MLAEARNSTAADTTAMHATRRSGSSTLKSASHITRPMIMLTSTSAATLMTMLEVRSARLMKKIT